QGQSSANAAGIDAFTALNCYGYSDASYGVYAVTAQNCYGYSIGGGTGVYANIAQNCFGYSSGSGDGVYATYTAIGCFGQSTSGCGLLTTRLSAPVPVPEEEPFGPPLPTAASPTRALTSSPINTTCRKKIP